MPLNEIGYSSIPTILASSVLQEPRQSEQPSQRTCNPYRGMRCTQGEVHGKLSMDGDTEETAPQRDAPNISEALYLGIATPHARPDLENTPKTKEHLPYGRPHMF